MTSCQQASNERREAALERHRYAKRLISNLPAPISSAGGLTSPHLIALLYSTLFSSTFFEDLRKRHCDHPASLLKIGSPLHLAL